MKIKEVYELALLEDEGSVILLVDFLMSKKAISLEDDVETLRKYFLDKNAERMNQLLHDFNESMKILTRKKRRETFMIRYQNMFYYVVAYSEEQAKTYFLSTIGNPENIEIQPEQTEVTWNNIQTTFEEIANRQKKLPEIVGAFELFEKDGEMSERYKL